MSARVRALEPVSVLCVTDMRVGYPMRQRHDAMVDLGLRVEAVDYWRRGESRLLGDRWGRLLHWMFRRGLGNFGLVDRSGTNRAIVDSLERRRWDFLWLDRALTVERATLETVKSRQPDCVVVGFSHDDMAQRHNQSRQFLEHLPSYDVFYTTKSYNVAELRQLGCKRCEFIDNSYDPATHRPIYGAGAVEVGPRSPVGFIGTWELERESLFGRLVRAGLRVHVWGGNWHNCSLLHENFELTRGDILGDEYARALCSTDVALCLLRRMNRDLQTTRSVEIPACGTFMLAERTDEHLALFEEGREAEYFSGPEELIEKASYYLKNPEPRKRIAEAGRRRCLRGGYSNQERLSHIFTDLCA